MLQALAIQNFALIEEAEISFSNGFIAITGETGSGKSILLGALNLILGERADYSVIRNAESKTVVEGTFNLEGSFKSWFDENELDFETSTVIRREISSQGKSRAFINDTPVGLNVLKELTEQLIYIHSQHQTLALKQSQFQFDVLDSFANATDLAVEVKNNVAQLRRLKNELENLRNSLSSRQREIEFSRFQLNELMEHSLNEINYSQLDQELNSLSNVDQIKELFGNVSAGIGEDGAVLDRLRVLKSLLEKQRQNNTKAEEFYTRISSSLIELEDLSSDAQNELDKLESDPEKIAGLVEKVDKFNRLLSKYGVQTQDELMAIQSKLEDELQNEDAKDGRISSLELEIDALERKTNNLASKLFKIRKEAALAVSKNILSSLDELKMLDSRIEFQLTKLDELDLNGGMTIECLFSANKALEMKSIEKAVSGGELSRVMLAIQKELSDKKGLPTLILDEIDTGVSGEVAFKVGQFLSKIGAKLQCIAVTHLPQVAAKANSHLEVSKSDSRTKINVLSQDERLVAIAKMMSGENVTDAALENAKALILPN